MYLCTNITISHALLAFHLLIVYTFFSHIVHNPSTDLSIKILYLILYLVYLCFCIFILSFSLFVERAFAIRFLQNSVVDGISLIMHEILMWWPTI